jgi:hypothetical protein
MYLKLKNFAKRIWDSVIIPSALVKKAGSDFDIDKLSMYLKNLFSDNAGRLKVVPFLSSDKAKEQYGKLYDAGYFDDYVAGIKDSLPLGSMEDALMEYVS